MQNSLFDLFFATFTCIGIVSAVWYFIGIALRKSAQRHNIFTIVLPDPSRADDIDSIKRTLWYVDNFTSDRVFFVPGCPDTQMKEELRSYCDTLCGTKLAERCEIYDILFHQAAGGDNDSR